MNAWMANMGGLDDLRRKFPDLARKFFTIYTLFQIYFFLHNALK